MTTAMQMAKMSELGQGATTVAFATQVGTQAYVLKQLKPEEHGNRRLRRLFPILASSASQFHHKHLARIFQIDAESIQVLMQHFPQTLQSRKFKNVDGLLSLLTQSLKGLRYLHQQNSLHLNLKPSNIMFEESGNLRLADPLCFSPGSTVSFGINPDYRFFSPAQLDPSVQVSPACDVYGLAMTIALTLNESEFDNHISKSWNEPIFESAKSVVPAPHFAGSNSRSKTRSVGRWSKWHSDYRYPNPSFRVLSTAIPESLVGILDRMLEKGQSLRFQNANEVLEALSETDEGRSVEGLNKSRPVSVSEKKNWATGIETVFLGGTEVGASQFSTTAFEIGSEWADGGTRTTGSVRFEPDGASWFLDVDSSKRFLINGELKSGRIAVGHGDILRLGLRGPDILIHRNETDPERINVAAREAMLRDVERVAAAETDVPDTDVSVKSGSRRSNHSDNTSSLLPLLFITAIAAIVACILMYLVVIGGSQ